MGAKAQVWTTPLAGGGWLVVTAENSQEEETPSIIDYFCSGIEVSLVGAVDYTGVLPGCQSKEYVIR